MFLIPLFLPSKYVKSRILHQLQIEYWCGYITTIQYELIYSNLKKMLFILLCVGNIESRLMSINISK